MSKLRNSNLFAARACRVLFEKRRKRNSIEFWFSDCQSHPEYQDDDHVTVWQQLANIRPCMRNIFWPSSWRSFWRGSRWTPRRAGSGCCWRTRRPPWSAASSGAQSRWTSNWRSGAGQFLFFFFLGDLSNPGIMGRFLMLLAVLGVIGRYLAKAIISDKSKWRK